MSLSSDQPTNAPTFRTQCVANSRGSILIANEKLRFLTLTNPYTSDPSKFGEIEQNLLEIELPSALQSPDGSTQYDILLSLNRFNRFLAASINSQNLILLEDRSSKIKYQALSSTPVGMADLADGKILTLYSDPSLDRDILELNFNPSENLFEVESTLGKSSAGTNDMAVAAFN
jgi:hypothetical protein